MQQHLRKTTAAILLLLSAFIIHNSAFAQNVGVSATGATPDNSAMLDVVSTTKGMLIPRVSLTSLTDAATITTPAASLMVYNTNAALTGGTGYYYNAGTTVSPLWVKFLNTGAGTAAADAWLTKGNSGTAWNTNFLGTTDNVSLRLRTNNIERVIVDSLGIVDFPNQSRTKAISVSPTTIPSTSGWASNNMTLWTKITINSIVYDKQNEFDVTTNYRFTAKKAGYYMVVGSIRCDNAVAGSHYWIGIAKNGSIVRTVQSSPGAAGWHIIEATDIISLNANDYIELYGRQDSGANLTVQQDGGSTFLIVTKLY